LDYLITHTIWRGFPPSIVNYKKGCTRLAVASDKVYQLPAHGRWFSPGTPASSTTKTGHHEIAESSIKHNKSINQSIIGSPYLVYTLTMVCICQPGMCHLTFTSFSQSTDIVIPPLPEGAGGYTVLPLSVTFFSATIDDRDLIFGHKRHIGTRYRGKRFWTHQIPTSCLSILLIFIHI
jgi:hypothetical protein